ncbi:MAG: non-heme iron oxygenase ferredoxin subunit [Pirellulaceae bacterium]
MAEYVRVAAVGDIPSPGKDTFEIDGRFVVVFHVDGSAYCLDDVCTHDDGPLGEGELVDGTISCPRHGAKFDIRTGAAVSMPATKATVVHEAKIEDDGIWVRLNEDN